MKYALTVALEAQLEDRTKQVRSFMAASTQAVLQIGRLLKEVRSEILSDGDHFKAYVADDLGMDPSYAYKMIKAFDTYGSYDDVDQVSAGVLYALMTSDDPQARLREALEAQKDKGTRVTVKEAKELAKAAAKVIDEGEVEVFTPRETTTSEDLRILMEEDEEQQIPSSSTENRHVERAKRTLKTLFDLLVIEMTNAEVTDEDVRNAVLEMLLSSDPSEVETASQLREFCTIVSSAV